MADPALLDPPPAAPAAELADLVLARLLPARGSVPLRRLRADLGSVLRDPPAAGDIAAAVAVLRAEGFVTPRAQRLTDAGRARARAFLGVDRVPGRGDWAAVKAKCLLPKALGRPAPPGTARLAALLLRRKLGLPAGTGPTLAAAFEAIACRELGFPDHATLKSLLPVLLGRAVGADAALDAGAAETVVPRVLLDLPRGGTDALRRAALADWLAGRAEPPRRPAPAPRTEPFDLEMFAATVRAAARDCPTGRAGGTKVFISHVWRQLRDEPRFAPLGVAGFKARLVDAHRADLLTLSRADLVQLVDPADVRESETRHLTGVFHFIAAEG